MMTCRIFTLILAIRLWADVTALLPPAEFEPGWRYQFEPEIYTSDNLHEYIDGEAELFKQYDVMEMATATYIYKKDQSQSFTIELYDMGTPLNAFGIYSYYRRPELNFADIGQQAVVSEASIRFWQDRYFIRMNAGSMFSFIAETMRAQAESMAVALPDSSLPSELALLPNKSRKPNTLKYIASPYHGLSSLRRTIEARYLTDNAEWTGFIVLFSSATDAEKAKIDIDAQVNEEKMILRQKSSYVLGVRDFTAKQEAVAFLNQLVKKF